MIIPQTLSIISDLPLKLPVFSEAAVLIFFQLVVKCERALSVWSYQNTKCEQMKQAVWN